MLKQALFFLGIFIVALLPAQDTHKVFASPTLVWYGMDFTKAKMIGFGDESPHKIRDEYFRAWNTITIELDLAKILQKNSVAKDPNGVTKMNLARETETLKSSEDVEMNPEIIADMVSRLPVGQKKAGVGMVFIVQSFNKTADSAIVHVTFFDIENRSILFTKKMTAKPGGGNPQKAWSSALQSIFDRIQKKEFNAWKKETNY